MLAGAERYARLQNEVQCGGILRLTPLGNDVQAVCNSSFNSITLEIGVIGSVIRCHGFHAFFLPV